MLLHLIDEECEILDNFKCIVRSNFKYLLILCFIIFLQNNQSKTHHLFAFQFGRWLQVEADVRGRVRLGGRDQGL
jgi:hypothetical protein